MYKTKTDNNNRQNNFVIDQRFRGDILLTSNGLNTKKGTTLIAKQLQNLSLKTILLVIPPKYTFFNVDIAVISSCEKIGFEKSNIFLSTKHNAPEKVDYIYVTEGNAFEILDYLRKEDVKSTAENLINYIRRNIADGSTYIGASAGAILASVDIRLALEFDKDSCNTNDFSSLGLFNGVVIPHYTTIELMNFIINSTEEELAPYDTIYNIDNDSVLCL